MIETREIKYVDGYKYQLREAFIFHAGIKPPYPIAAPLVTLRTDGMLIVGKYYAYDGPSGPTIDDATNMRGALVHDVFYYLMRMKFIDIKYREAADWLLKKCMI